MDFQGTPYSRHQLVGFLFGDIPVIPGRPSSGLSGGLFGKKKSIVDYLMDSCKCPCKLSG